MKQSIRKKKPCIIGTLLFFLLTVFPEIVFSVSKKTYPIASHVSQPATTFTQNTIGLPYQFIDRHKNQVKKSPEKPASIDAGICQLAPRSGSPYQVTDSWPYLCWLALIVIIAGGFTLALILCRHQQLRRRLLELTDQIELLHNGQRLFSESLRHLGDVASDFSSKLDGNAAFEALHQYIYAQFATSALIIYHVDRQAQRLERAYAWKNGLPLKGIYQIDLNSATSGAAQAARSGEPVQMMLDATSNGYEYDGTPGDMRSNLFVPLMVSGKVLGVISLQSSQQKVLDHSEHQIFRTLVSYTAMALHNAALYQKVEASLLAQKAAQNQLQAKNQELAAAYKIQGEHQNELTRFLAVASHDLRQPMHALILYMGALGNCELPEAASDILYNALECAHIMDNMFMELLDLSSLDSQVVVPFIEHFPISSLLQRIKIEFTQQAQEKGLQLRIAPCSGWIKSDSTLIEQILRNFTANAIRYTDRGKILIGCRRLGTRLRLAVFDTGIGISPDQQKSVFDEFSQLRHTDRDRSRGLGLGLAIVRRIAHLLSIPVTLISLPARGSMFAIDLELSQERQPDQKTSRIHIGTESLRPRSAVSAQSEKLIVIVDDEPSILSAMRLLCEQWGYQVVTATSTSTALTALSRSERAPDILICDYHLKGKETGLHVIEALQIEFNCEIPSIIITGSITLPGTEEMQVQDIRIMHKPLNACVLHQALAQMIAPLTPDIGH